MDRAPLPFDLIPAHFVRDVERSFNSLPDAERLPGYPYYLEILTLSAEPTDVPAALNLIEEHLVRIVDRPARDAVDILFCLAIVHYRNGDVALSRQTLTRCFEVDPNHVKAKVFKDFLEGGSNPVSVHIADYLYCSLAGFLAGTAFFDQWISLPKWLASIILNTPQLRKAAELSQEIEQAFAENTLYGVGLATLFGVVIAAKVAHHYQNQG